MISFRLILFDFFDVHILSTVLRKQGVFFVGKIAEEDINLQGQGFVLRVQRTAHIEKWTKCYSKNLFPPSINIYICTYICIYIFIVSQSFFFSWNSYLSRLLRRSLRTLSSSSYRIFLYLRLSRSHAAIVTCYLACYGCIHKNIIYINYTILIFILISIAWDEKKNTKIWIAAFLWSWLKLIYTE